MPSMPGALPMHSSLIPQPPPAAYNTFRIRLVPHLDSRRSLRFDAITRDLGETDPALRIGRFTDRSGMGLAAVNALGTNKLAFKSKVVSRAHAEIWVEKAGKFFIKDTKSSSGTFLNHIRLSPANQESRPHQLKDGDILQLGVDYQGGAEDIYKSVKIRVENLAAVVGPNVQAALPTVANGKVATRSSKLQIPDCCICLFSVTIRQALFIAPCSHAFHFKCIRPLIEAHHPAFSCPLCRTYADLEEDVEVDSAELEADAEVGTDADIEIDEASSGAQHKESDTNAARTPLQQLQREDAEMSDGSSAPHVPPSLPSVPVAPAAISIIAAPTGRLRPISENGLHLCSDRDREAGGETEVEPDSVPSLSSFLAARRGRGGTGGRMRHTSPELCTEEDEGLPGMVTGVEEADEVEMGDALEYNEPEEDSAMDEEHDREPAGIPMAVVAIDELGVIVGPAAAGTVSGGSIGGKRKR
ncbi:hypothetical protein APHAL10511_003900 [Amanita phalloides]|nr:hypothetical protein APHAL10511_003900 [Amanita phalloides]